MSFQQLRLGNVVYGVGVGGTFDKCLGKVTKVNPSKPVVEDGTGHRGSYWKLNLKKIGTIKSRFGSFYSCKTPSEDDQPCPYSATQAADNA